MYTKKKRLVDQNISNKNRFLNIKKLSDEELELIERFLPGILFEINDFQKSLSVFVENNLSNEKVSEIIKGLELLSRWETFPVFLKNELIRKDILGTQKISIQKILLPGIGAVHIQKGVLTQIIVDTQFAIGSIICYFLFDTEKPMARELLHKLEKIHLLFTPKLKT